MQIDGVKELIAKELAEANEKKPLFVDNHQAYAVILEEMEEAREALGRCEYVFEQLWKSVRADETIFPTARLMGKYAIDAIAEAIQVAAMCQKAIDSEMAREKAAVSERKELSWIFAGQNTEGDVYECSCCGYVIDSGYGKATLPDICPGCGAIRKR